MKRLTTWFHDQQILSFRALLIGLCLCLQGCYPSSFLNKSNLLHGARAETFILNHGALCSRLPSIKAIDLYSQGLIPAKSSIGRDVHAWDMSGLLNIIHDDDGGWIILPSEGLKKINKVHFREDAKGDRDALCFGKIWIDSVVSYKENAPFGIKGAVTARFRAHLKDAYMLKYFKGLKVEAFDPSTFSLVGGLHYAEDLQDGFEVDMPLRPTPAGWYFAKNPLP